MAGANLDPFFGIAIASGPMSTPQTITNNPAGGPNMVMQTTISQLPPPILTSQAVPPTTHGGSGPSTYIAPPVTHGGSGPSTYTAPPITHGGSGPSIHTVPHTTLGGIVPSTMAPPAPPSMQVHYAPANPTTIPSPSHNLGSNLPFMAHLNLPDLAQLTNNPIRHQTFWPPMPTKLPSDIPKFEGKEGECPQNHIMTFNLWCS